MECVTSNQSNESPRENESTETGNLISNLNIMVGDNVAKTTVNSPRL